MSSAIGCSTMIHSGVYEEEVCGEGVRRASPACAAKRCANLSWYAFNKVQPPIGTLPAVGHCLEYIAIHAQNFSQ
jgi:hypothetical protein